ncbi:MAG: exo-alpha-sialidase [Candidatus Hodarchaeota archaeon]
MEKAKALKIGRLIASFHLVGIAVVPIWAFTVLCITYAPVGQDVIQGIAVGVLLGIGSTLLMIAGTYLKKKYRLVLIFSSPLLLVIPVLIGLKFVLDRWPFDEIRWSAFAPGVLFLAIMFFTMLFIYIGGISLLGAYRNYQLARGSRASSTPRGRRIAKNVFSTFFVIALLSATFYAGYEFHGGNSNFFVSSNEPFDFDTGIDSSMELFQSSRDGYHTYRIPALLAIPGNTLLAFCEARKYSSSDHGKIDLVMRRSEDDGSTWSTMEVIWSYGTTNDEWNTIGNPCPVYDNDTGKIFLPFNRNNALAFVMNSSDGGKTWGAPVNVTSIVNPTWRVWNSETIEWDRHWHAFGPGHGIQLQHGTNAGRLVIPSYGGVGNSHAMYSDDHGITWQLGSPTTDGGECEAVETVNGSLYFTLRDNSGRERAWSHDGGATLQPAISELSLVGPACMASICRYSDNITGTQNRILFSGPGGTARDTFTIRVSQDECTTWNVSKVLYQGPSAYSDLQVLPDGKICLLVERGQDSPYQFISFVRFTFDWLV